jgi:peptide deformylase
MAILEILHHPDPRLRERARTVTDITAETQKLIDDMFETMYAAPGVGLAATQVGIAQRIAVMDCSENKDQPIVMINPEISSPDEPVEVEEGCLSVPGFSDTVKRYHRLHLRALDRHGKPYELDAEGLLAQCIQHEAGHLNGQLYIDLLSELKRGRITKKLQKDQREGVVRKGPARRGGTLVRED